MEGQCNKGPLVTNSGCSLYELVIVPRYILLSIKASTGLGAVGIALSYSSRGRGFDSQCGDWLGIFKRVNIFQSGGSFVQIPYCTLHVRILIIPWWVHPDNVGKIKVSPSRLLPS